MSEKQFPILKSYGSPAPKRFEHIKTFPWSVIEGHEAQAKANHYQTLKRLAERGGLSASEAVAVLENREWRNMSAEDAYVRLLEIVDSKRAKDKS